MLEKIQPYWESALPPDRVSTILPVSNSVFAIYTIIYNWLKYLFKLHKQLHNDKQGENRLQSTPMTNYFIWINCQHFTLEYLPFAALFKCHLGILTYNEKSLISDIFVIHLKAGHISILRLCISRGYHHKKSGLLFKTLKWSYHWYVHIVYATALKVIWSLPDKATTIHEIWTF